MTGPEGGVKEIEPLSGRTVLVTGGATGLGLETAKALSAEGANLIIGTRSADNFVKAEQTIGSDVYPFIADLTQPTAVLKALKDLSEPPTDLILSAAGGMESFSKEFALRLARAAKSGDIQKKKDILKELDVFVRDQVEGSKGFADDVNYFANEHLVREMGERFPDIKVIFFSSIPSSFVQHQVPPAFYRSVANSKGAFERWMALHGEKSHSPEMWVISGGVIEDSIVGKLISRFVVPMLTEEERGRLEQGYIRNLDMVEATLKAMRGEIVHGEENPKTIYVTGKDKIVDEVRDDDPVFAFNGIDFGQIADRL